MTRWLIAFAGVAGAVAVGFGAFGAHALAREVARGPPGARSNSGVRYLFFHIPALLAVAWLSSASPCGGNTFATVAGWSFVLGMMLFSGSLITLALTGEKRWGRVTPVGGVLLIVGWIALAGAGFSATSASHVFFASLVTC